MFYEQGDQTSPSSRSCPKNLIRKTIRRYDQKRYQGNVLNKLYKKHSKIKFGRGFPVGVDLGSWKVGNQSTIMAAQRIGVIYHQQERGLIGDFYTLTIQTGIPSSCRSPVFGIFYRRQDTASRRDSIAFQASYSNGSVGLPYSGIRCESFILALTIISCQIGIPLSLAEVHGQQVSGLPQGLRVTIHAFLVKVDIGAKPLINLNKIGSTGCFRTNHGVTREK